MPEEGKSELGSDSNFVKEIYIDREVVSDKFWIEDSISYVEKRAKDKLETFILKDERVILLMGSDCSTEDLMMDDKVLSDWSSDALFIIDNVTNSVISNEKLNAFGKETGFSQKEINKYKEAELISPVIADDSSGNEFHDQVNEDIISYDNEIDKEVEESVGTKQYSGTLPYSGSISLRSTSSTASTQSFAFPILAEECDSSPIRMPKPEKRQLTKPKQWRLKMCWVCSKF